jgi:hypothetical protein
MIRERLNSLGREIFQLDNVEYPYFIHPYNTTWTNERAVEIPVVRRFLKYSESSSTLEIGNVLSHYFDTSYTVVDKYEKCRYRPVINEDFVDFNSHQRFNLIVSISTIEHVGWDEKPRDEARVMMAFTKIRSLLGSSGKAIVTIPVGYNHYLDQRIHEIATDGIEFRCMKRISEDNRWIEIDLMSALLCKYNSPYKNANALVFVYIKG